MWRLESLYIKVLKKLKPWEETQTGENYQLFTMSGDTNSWALLVIHYEWRQKQVRITSDSLWVETQTGENY